MVFADITEAMEHMFSRITEHLPIVLSGIITRREEVTILTPAKEDILALIVPITITDHIAGGNKKYFSTKKEKN